MRQFSDWRTKKLKKKKIQNDTEGRAENPECHSPCKKINNHIDEEQQQEAPEQNDIALFVDTHYG